MDDYVPIHKHTKKSRTVGNYELEEVAILLLSILIVYIFQRELPLGVMGGIIWLGYEGMLKLHEVNSTRVRSYKFHILYKLGFKTSEHFPPTYIKEFTGN